ncbi:hypothetical protein AC578_1877 [Pseudocercospora eumusae]|uniref:Oxidoreductase-like domain-containing protein n=1 Tax=Pseudocercospora eumusae TaxID=321146 RepID=A0A139H3I9_9PEZI|nr:hypothetical protein AC578_1877 [Pseudocercospora eumusae]
MRPAVRRIPRSIPQPCQTHKTPPCAQIRCFTTSSSRDNTIQPEQVRQIQGYYADLLDAPLRKEPQHIDRPYADPSPEDPMPMLTEKEKTRARARKVFGDRLADAAERKRQMESKSQMIAGILVPPKPEEPDNCCMSGCVNCVWERFREELEEYAMKMREAKQKLQALRTSGQATGMMGKEAGMPDHVAISMDDDGGGSETLWRESSGTEAMASPVDIEGDTDPLEGIPIGIREFMKTEKKLKQKHKERGEYIETALDTELRPEAWASSGS